jgi:broad specificity phosphatase PhoE
MMGAGLLFRDSTQIAKGGRGKAPGFPRRGVTERSEDKRAEALLGASCCIATSDGSGSNPRKARARHSVSRCRSPHSMSVIIIFESHGTTYDNEAHLASGHFDVELSPLGIKQSGEMGERYKDDRFDAIFCSDLRRSYKSAELAFGDKFPIIKDARLRECDYGDLTRHPSAEVDRQKIQMIHAPFPNGESYEQTSERIRSFLADLLEKYDGKRVMIIGHRATQYGLEHWINDASLEAVISAAWKWQPGWEYKLAAIS